MVGRHKEQNILKKLLQTSGSEFVTVIGRRRIGKTYLIRTCYEKEIAFEITGIQNATFDEQLNNFLFSLRYYFGHEERPEHKPQSWLEAFQMLIIRLERLKTKKKVVIFLDELPWLATARSGFIKGLSFFWNSWASKNNIVLATCGSAASWMIQKVILNKGGLHNRVTKQIVLQPFTLSESMSYLKSRGIRLEHYQMAQLYMTLGGIPYYLKQVPMNKSVPEIISELIFDKSAPLRYEFENLYQALFSNYEKYITIIEACYSKWKGITHTELIKITGFKSGGSLTRMINDLVVSRFLNQSQPYGKKKKESLIRLIDEFSIFYLKFKRNTHYINWRAVSQSQSYKSWQGFAFENLCHKHIPEIKKALGISGINTSEYSLYIPSTKNNNAAQIDLIIDRNDEVIHLCEVKFHNKEFTISKSYRSELETKIRTLRAQLPPYKIIHLTAISTFGIKENKHSNIVNHNIRLKNLF